MANDVSKTISLQELYAMMQPYKKAFISLFSGDESTVSVPPSPLKQSAFLITVQRSTVCCVPVVPALSYRQHLSRFLHQPFPGIPALSPCQAPVFSIKSFFCEHFINIQLFPLKCVFRCGIV